MEFLEEYDSEEAASVESSDESSHTSENSEEIRDREIFHRGDADFPLILETTSGMPLVVYQDRTFTTNKRKHNDSDPVGFDTIYMVNL